MKKAKKPIALLLVLLLFVSLLPAGALAADDAEPAVTFTGNITGSPDTTVSMKVSWK